MRLIREILYSALFLGSVCVSLMGYNQVLLVRAENTLDKTATWLPKQEVVRLMRYHGTDGLKITQDEVYIYRGERWIPVMKRGRG